MTPTIHIIRHGQSIHNVFHGYPHRDPPLTDAGQKATEQIKISAVPDLIVVSPMTRTIQTAMNAFPSILGSTSFQPEVQIWPDLREVYNATCNQGLSRAEISAKFPQFNFEECPEEWDYPPSTIESATARAEIVRRRLQELSKAYRNIVLITHRGFIAFLVGGDRYNLCETRSYQFSAGSDTKEPQGFDPTVLVPYEIRKRLGEDDMASLTMK